MEAKLEWVDGEPANLAAASEDEDAAVERLRRAGMTTAEALDALRPIFADSPEQREAFRKLDAVAAEDEEHRT